MGLRFRKSITLCKGVRLNVGKTGVSISAGIPGFRKTIHSSGRVTTTVGIPGSGLYYVDTDHVGSKKRQQPKRQEHSVPTQQPAPIYSNVSPIQVLADSSISSGNGNATSAQVSAERLPGCYFARTPIVDSPPIIVEREMRGDSELPHSPTFRDLFENCDLPISWIDVLANREPLDDRYDANTWSYLHSKAVSVFEGDIEAMLQIVDEVSPFDDLNRYTSDFCVEMEEPTELCIEFSVTKNIAPRNELQDAVCSVLIRAARDAFALLPIETIIAHVVLEGNTIIAARFGRETFASLEFEKKDPAELLSTLDVNMNYSSKCGFQNVDRFV